MESVVLIVTLEFWHLSGGWNGPCYRCSACRRSKPRLPPWSGQGWDSTLQDWRKETKLWGEMIEKVSPCTVTGQNIDTLCGCNIPDLGICKSVSILIFTKCLLKQFQSKQVQACTWTYPLWVPTATKLPRSAQETDVTVSLSLVRSQRRVTWATGFIKFSGCSLLMQMWHLAGAGWPEVDTGSKSNAQHILTTPVHLWFEFYFWKRMLNALCAIHSCMKQIPDWDRSRPAALGHRELWKGFWRSCAKPSSDSWVTLLQQITRGRCTMITWAAFDFWKTQGWGCRGTVAHWQCCAF